MSCVPSEPDYQYDLFVSCAVADLKWVNGFLLPELGLSKERIICNQPLVSAAASFRAGAPIPEEFQRAVTGSRFTLLILSPAYVADVWTVHSAQMVSYLTVEERRNRLIPLEREKSKLPLDIEFRVRFDCSDEDNWKAATAKLRDLLDQPEPAPERIPCPYPGMVPFSAKDARFFYGREDEIKQMLQDLRRQRYLWVIGPSGSGKSSLVFAGLLLKLIESSYFSPGFWLVRSMRPGSRPVQELAGICGDLSGSGESVDSLLRANTPAQRLLLVIDQFDELLAMVIVSAI